MIDDEQYDELIKSANDNWTAAEIEGREAVYKKLADEVQVAFDNWTNSGHQKHTRAVFRNLEKVYARITGRAWR